MNYLKFYSVLIFCFISCLVNADQKFSLNNCKAFILNHTEDIDTQNSDSLFWKIEKQGYKTSYLYGTMHSSDPRVLDIPENVLNALQNSDQFILELLLTPELEIQLSQRMFSANDQLLLEYVEPDVMNKMARILALYNIPEQYVKLMQPWAAYLVMNYPENNGTILDLKLLEIARQQNKQLKGLETMEQQLAVFDNLNHHQQTHLLFDSVCHYQTIQNDLNTVIDFYVNNDLLNVVKAANKYSIINEQLYQQLYEQLVNVRNHNMVKNIIDNLNDTSNFIAIGSLHLVGKQGVVALLKQQGYKLTPIH